jgi:hypothetical protein
MISNEVQTRKCCLPISRMDLGSCLHWIWEHYFCDIPRCNEVAIEYRYPWKTRLGMIHLSSDTTHTLIGMNTLLQLPLVPEEVLLITIAHELCHYAHGFGSPLLRKYASPHAHQVVEKELGQRQLGVCLTRCEEWIEQHWFAFYEQQRASGWSCIGGPHAVARPRKLL